MALPWCRDLVSVTHVVIRAVFHSPVSNGSIDINRPAVENPGRVFTCVMYRDCIYEVMYVQQRCPYMTMGGRSIRTKMLRNTAKNQELEREQLSYTMTIRELSSLRSRYRSVSVEIKVPRLSRKALDRTDDDLVATEPHRIGLPWKG